MLELTKTVLRRVSFDSYLFKKELVKAKKWLRKEEQLLLKAWALATFAGTHHQIILEVYGNVA